MPAWVKVRLWTRSKAGVVALYGSISIPQLFPTVTMKLNPRDGSGELIENPEGPVEHISFKRDTSMGAGPDAVDYIADWEPKKGDRL